MPQLIHTTSKYFYDNCRDLLVLQIRTPGALISIDRDDEQTKKIENEQLSWLADRGIEVYKTCGDGVLEGWFGEYFVDVEIDDPVVAEYSQQFETTDGKSLDPDYYQMCLYSYQEWLDSGGIEKHEQHMKDLADPNYLI